MRKIFKTLSVLFLTVLTSFCFSSSSILAASNYAVTGLYGAYVDANHNLWMWGDSQEYDFVKAPDGGSLSAEPRQVMSDISKVEIGPTINAVIKTDGTLWTWGDNSYGTLGNGTYTDESNNPNMYTPVKILDDVKDVKCGEMHAAALKNDNTLWAWGDTFYGAVGVGKAYTTQATILDRAYEPSYFVTSPTKILDNVQSFDCGIDVSGAVTTDGNCLLWGSVRCYPDFGDDIVSSPKQAFTDVKSISLSDSWYVGGIIKNDNSLQTFGSRNYDQIGDGKTIVIDPNTWTIVGEEYTNPVEVAQNIKDVQFGLNQALALTTNGDLLTWGSPPSLGDGQNSTDGKSVLSPQKITSGVMQIQTSSDLSSYVDGNGNIFACGAYIPIIGESYTFTKVATISGNSSNPSPEPSNPSPAPNPEPSNPDTPSNSTPVYRLYNETSGEHLYTADLNEYNTLPGMGWTQEDIGWNAPTKGTPVYRLYNPALADHLYTTDENEVKVLTTERGWQSDNNGLPLFYSDGATPVYRLYNEGNFRHLLTRDEYEYTVLGNSGWTQEGQKLSCLS